MERTTVLPLNECFKLIYTCVPLEVTVSGAAAILQPREAALLPPHHPIRLRRGDCLPASDKIHILEYDAYSAPAQLLSLLPAGHPAAAMLRQLTLDAFYVFHPDCADAFTESLRRLPALSESEDALQTSVFILALQCLLYGNYTCSPYKMPPQVFTLSHLMRYLYAHYKTASLQSASAALKRSPEYLSRLVKKTTGQNFSDILNDLRLKNAAVQLAESTVSEAGIAQELGYKSLQYFRIAFKKKYGTTPLTYRKQRSKGGGL